MKKMKKISQIILLILLIIPFSAQAFSFDDFFGEFDDWFSEEATSTNSVQVKNEVSVSANTGGNQTSGSGQIEEGQGKVEVEIKTIINGQEIEPINIEQEGKEVKVESKIEAEGEVADVQREIEIDSEKKSENYEVNLGNSEVEQKDEGILKENLNIVQEWWSDFIGDFKDFFQDIFNFF